jgi:diguanylate cyclase (GGDEF)-like protein
LKQLAQSYRWLAALLMAGVLFLWGTPAAAWDGQPLVLSDAERAYIKELGTLRVTALDGAAPLCYTDHKGQPQGIAWKVIDRVAELTGLSIERFMCDGIDQLLEGDYDIVAAMSPNYSLEGMELTRPYLSTRTILFLNNSLRSDALADKTFAAVRGGSLPEGISLENTIFYDTRAESMDAVNRGEADYGYGNAFSVYYYSLQRDYKNILTIPLPMEGRAYSIGLIRQDPMLLSILNKAIDAISEEDMQHLVLSAIVYAERAPSLSSILDAYGSVIAVGLLIVLAGLTLSIVTHMHMNKRLRTMNRRLAMQNNRHEHLAALSGEYLYEYFLSSENLELSEPCARLLEAPGATEALKSMLRHIGDDGHTSTLMLPLMGDQTGVFRSIHSFVYDEDGRASSIIGKLLDISAETAEKKKLIIESQTDGLTRLYNATTAQELMTQAIRQRPYHQTDALVLMDCDNFKVVNDTYGHLAGNQLLENLAECLRKIFGDDTIIGRMGGDEFAVYIKNAPSAADVESQCNRLHECVLLEAGEIPTAVSIGVVLVRDTASYETLFTLADDALYQAKRDGKNRTVILDQRYRN